MDEGHNQRGGHDQRPFDPRFYMQRFNTYGMDPNTPQWRVTHQSSPFPVMHGVAPLNAIPAQDFYGPHGQYVPDLAFAGMHGVVLPNMVPAPNIYEAHGQYSPDRSMLPYAYVPQGHQQPYPSYLSHLHSSPYQDVSGRGNSNVDSSSPFVFDLPSVEAPSSSASVSLSPVSGSGLLIVKLMPNCSNAAAVEETFTSVPDLNLKDFVIKNGPLVRWHELFILKLVLVLTSKGRKVLCNAYRHVIDMFRNGHSWGGMFEEEHMMFTKKSQFYITLEANQDPTLENLLADLKKLTNLVASYYRGNHILACQMNALYVHHLFEICSAPPQVIRTSGHALKKFLDFIYYHLSFGHPVNRSDLVKAGGSLIRRCGTRDAEYVEMCLDAAFDKTFWAVDWRNEIYGVPILDEVLWFGVTEEDRRLCPRPRLRNNARDLFRYCRNSVEHGAESSFVDELPLNVVDVQQQIFENHALQAMPSIVEMDYMIGLPFDLFICESFCNLLLSTRLERNRFLSDPWKAFARSFGGSDENEDDY